MYFLTLTLRSRPLHIHPANLQQRVFFKQSSSSSKLPLWIEVEHINLKKTTEEEAATGCKQWLLLLLARETSVDAAGVTVPCFHCALDWLWREFSSTLRCTVANHELA